MRRNHTTSLHVVLAAINSASAVDMAMVGCILERQLSGEPLRKRMYAPTDLRVSVSEPQSESQNP